MSSTVIRRKRMQRPARAVLLPIRSLRLRTMRNQNRAPVLARRCRTVSPRLLVQTSNHPRLEQSLISHPTTTMDTGSHQSTVTMLMQHQVRRAVQKATKKSSTPLDGASVVSFQRLGCDWINSPVVTSFRRTSGRTNIANLLAARSGEESRNRDRRCRARLRRTYFLMTRKRAIARELRPLCLRVTGLPCRPG